VDTPQLAHVARPDPMGPKPGRAQAKLGPGPNWAQSGPATRGRCGMATWVVLPQALRKTHICMYVYIYIYI